MTTTATEPIFRVNHDSRADSAEENYFVELYVNDRLVSSTWGFVRGGLNDGMVTVFYRNVPHSFFHNVTEFRDTSLLP